MAGKGLFDPDLVASSWFDPAQTSLAGWFDESLIDSTSSSILKLYLRNTTANGVSIGGVPCYDLLTTAGAAPDTAVVNTTAAGTEIQFTKTAGGSVAAFITGRVPAGGWTITSSDVALWLNESASTVNAGLRFRLFKYSGGTETELGGSPFDKGTEFNTANTLETLLGNVTDTALAEDDRLLLRIYAVNVGTMAAGTATLNFNGTSGGTAPVFRSSSTVTAASGSLSYPQPSGAAVGDFVLFAWTCFGPGTVGYASTMVGTTQNNQSGPDGEDTGFAGRILDGTETWPFVVTFSGGADRTGICAAFQYVNKDNPFDVTPSYTEAQGSIPTPITTASSGIAASPKSTLVWLANTDQTVAADRWSYSTPSGFTMREDVHSINWAHLALATQENFAGGFTGSVTATATRDSGTGNAGWAGYVIALRAIQAESYINVSPVIAFKAEGGGATQDLAPSLYTDSDTFYAATLNTSIALTPSLYTDADTFYAATLTKGAVDLAPPLYTDADTFYAATLNSSIALTPSLYTDADTFYSATLGIGAVNLVPALYTDVDTFYAATVTPGAVDLTPSLFTDADTFYAATVSQGGATQNLTPSLFTDADTFYAATLSASITLTPSLYTDADTFYAATLNTSIALTPSLYTDADTFYAATLNTSIALTPSLYTDADTFYAATVTPGAVNLTPSLYTDADTFYSATLSQAGGAQTLTVSLFTDADTFYAATVTPGAVNLTPSLYTDADTFYSATLSQAGGAQTLLPSLYTDADTFYAATVTPGAVSLTPSLFTDADTFYAATLDATITITPDLYTDADTFYAITLTQGAANLQASLFTDTDTFYDAVLTVPANRVGNFRSEQWRTVFSGFWHN